MTSRLCEVKRLMGRAIRLEAMEVSSLLGPSSPHKNGLRSRTLPGRPTVNQVISKRMVKKQQMRWSRRGAHLLLQVRTRELNGELRYTFARWYPALDREAEQRKEAA